MNSSVRLKGGPLRPNSECILASNAFEANEFICEVEGGPLEFTETRMHSGFANSAINFPLEVVLLLDGMEFGFAKHAIVLTWQIQLC